MKIEYLKQESLKWFEELHQPYKDIITIMLDEFNVTVEDGIFFKGRNDDVIGSMLQFKLFNEIKDSGSGILCSIINILTVWETDLLDIFPLNINEFDIKHSYI